MQHYSITCKYLYVWDGRPSLVAYLPHVKRILSLLPRGSRSNLSCPFFLSLHVLLHSSCTISHSPGLLLLDCQVALFERVNEESLTRTANTTSSDCTNVFSYCSVEPRCVIIAGMSVESPNKRQPNTWLLLYRSVPTLWKSFGNFFFWSPTARDDGMPLPGSSPHGGLMWRQQTSLPTREALLAHHRRSPYAQAWETAQCLGGHWRDLVPFSSR